MESIEDRIKLKLEKFDNYNGVIVYENLKTYLKDYLKRIEEIIIQKELQEKKAIEELKKNKLSVLSISEELGCSRTTLYNHNGFLKKYIEIAIDLIEEENPFVMYDKMKASIGVLESKIDKMTLRDIDTELLRVENNNLQKSLKEKVQEIERLQIRNTEISKELEKLKNTNTTEKSATLKQFPLL